MPECSTRSRPPLSCAVTCSPPSETVLRSQSMRSPVLPWQPRTCFVQPASRPRRGPRCARWQTFSRRHLASCTDRRTRATAFRLSMTLQEPLTSGSLQRAHVFTVPSPLWTDRDQLHAGHLATRLHDVASATSVVEGSGYRTTRGGAVSGDHTLRWPFPDWDGRS